MLPAAAFVVPRAERRIDGGGMTLVMEAAQCDVSLLTNGLSFAEVLAGSRRAMA